MSTLKVILVTGGSGLVGRAIKEVVDSDPQPNEKWIFLSSADADLTNIEASERIFMQYKPTHVVHLAAMVGGLFKNMRLGVEFFRQNMLINDTILQLGHKYGVEKLVSCLSTCIFPDKVSYPIDETMIHCGPPHESNAGYAWAKRMIDVQNKCYWEEYGCNFTSVVPTNVFGRYDNFNLDDAHVIPALIHKMYLAMKNDTVLTIAGSGRPLRQFIYAPDLARLFIWTLRNYDDVSPLILSPGEDAEISIGDVAGLIADAMGFPRDRVQYDYTLADGQYKKTASNGKLMALIGEFNFTPIEVAIGETVKWFIANYPSVRM